MPTRSPIHRPPFAKPRQQAERERKQRYDEQRPTAHHRGYDKRWRWLRERFIQFNPRCSEPGCDRPTFDVDHKISVAERPDLRLNWRNLRAFCHACHSRRTAKEQGFAK